MTEVTARLGFELDYFFAYRVHPKCLDWLLRNARDPDFAAFWAAVGWPEAGQHAGRKELLKLMQLGSV